MGLTLRAKGWQTVLEYLPRVLFTFERAIYLCCQIGFIMSV